jgi:SAM-dependent methyltransferase
MIHAALRRQYARTMREAYAFARASACSVSAGRILDCGSGAGHELLATFGSRIAEPRFEYRGLDWSAQAVAQGRQAGIDISEADLNGPLPVGSSTIDCAIAYSVVEHLLMPCSFLLECYRVLRPEGRLIILTPNISTYFTALQVLTGGMPSSGPHPDSNWLIAAGEPPKMSGIERDEVSVDTPQHRHLVVFSYKVLRRFLTGIGFSIVDARGFGYYPFPEWGQKWLERVDPYHCHQMVFVCERQVD